MIHRLMQNRVSRTYQGGERIEKFTGEKSAKEFYPEDWTGSVTSVGDEGLGKTVDGKLITEILGDNKLPILVKLLDSNERLVIQAHPKIDFSKKYLNSNFGKTECWYFLDCARDAYVYIGFKNGVTKEMWKSVIESQNIKLMKSYLHKVYVKKGDFIFVDGGIPHAIGEGCFMIELQEPTDYMVVSERFTPSGRELPKHRLTMGLAEEVALNVYDYTTYSEEELYKKYIKNIVVHKDSVISILNNSMTDKFEMALMCGSCEMMARNDYSIAIVVNGNGSFCGVNVKKGDRLFVEKEKHLTANGENLEIVICS